MLSQAAVPNRSDISVTWILESKGDQFCHLLLSLVVDVIDYLVQEAFEVFEILHVVVTVKDQKSDVLDQLVVDLNTNLSKKFETRLFYVFGVFYVAKALKTPFYRFSSSQTHLDKHFEDAQI